MSFSANEKVSQHFVPQFWQRRFRGPDNKLRALHQGEIKVVSPKNLMTRDWLYTVFDAHGLPSNHLEEWCSKVEGDAAQAPVPAAALPVDVGGVPVEHLLDLARLEVDQVDAAVALALLAATHDRRGNQPMRDHRRARSSCAASARCSAAGSAPAGCGSADRRRNRRSLPRRSR